MEESVYWLETDGKGRLAILPPLYGHHWLEGEIRSWRDAGIDVVVSLLEEHEIHDLELHREQALCESEGIAFKSFPIQDRGVPRSTSGTLQLVRELNDLWANGKNIGFHCYGCIGRSPLIACCLLVFSGKPAAEAVRTVSAARGFSVPETPEQVEWVRKFAREVNSNTEVTR